MSQPFNHARLKFICHFLGKCLFHAIHTIFKTQSFLLCLIEETITSTNVAASKTGNILSILSCFRLICFLAANTKFCFQSKFTFLCFLLFNFFLDCVIHKQSFGGKIIGFQSLKWPHNGYTVWGSKGKRSNSTPFCFGCPDTFVTGVYTLDMTFCHHIRKLFHNGRRKHGECNT